VKRLCTSQVNGKRVAGSTWRNPNRTKTENVTDTKPDEKKLAEKADVATNSKAKTSENQDQNNGESDAGDGQRVKGYATL